MWAAQWEYHSEIEISGQCHEESRFRLISVYPLLLAVHFISHNMHSLVLDPADPKMSLFGL